MYNANIFTIFSTFYKSLSFQFPVPRLGLSFTGDEPLFHRFLVLVGHIHTGRQP